jgi:hypothetical protein
MVQDLGSSDTTLDYISQAQIQSVAPARVVDFGAGAGKYGRLIRAVRGKDCHITAVDGFVKTAEYLSRNKDYDVACCALIGEWLASNTRQYDLAIFGDVLEHLSRREIFQTLRQARKWFNEIILVVPLFDVSQNAVYGNSLETHRAYISERYFDHLNPLEKHVVRTDKYVMMNIRINRSCEEKSWRTCSRHDLFRHAMVWFDRIGLAKTVHGWVMRQDSLDTGNDTANPG